MTCLLPFLKARIFVGLSLLAALAFAWPTLKIARAHPQPHTLAVQDAATLAPGQPVERELKVSETHTYALALVAGQYARIDVEQLGIQVSLTLLAPNQEKIFGFTGTVTGNRGKQIACLVAEQTGNYYVQIRAAYDYLKPARYVVQVSQLREASAQDRERFAAQKIYGEVSSNPRVQAPDAVRNSLKKLEAALLLSQKIEDQELEAFLLHEIGWRNMFDLPNELRAIECFGRALLLRRALGHKQEQAVALTALGHSHYMLGRQGEARAYLQEAIPLFREVGDKGNEGIALYRHGVTYFRESPRTMINYCLQAEPLLRAAGETEMETQVLYETALMWVFLGEPQKAFEASHKALLLAEPIAPIDPIHKANALLNLSRTHQAVGDYQKALDIIYEVLAIYQSIPDQEREAVAFYVLGTQYFELGETQRTIDFYQQSVQLFQKIGYEVRGLRQQAELPHAYYQLGQYQTARDYALSILPLTRKFKDKISEGRTLLGLGQAYQALGEYRKASECFEQATALLREMQFPAGEAQALHASGQAYAAQRNFPQALELYRQALALAQKINNPLVETQSLTGLARAEQALGALTAARTNNEAALKIVESVRSRVVSPALRASFLATRQSAYENYLALLMQQHWKNPHAGHATHALQMSEHARARSLVEMLTEASAKIRAGVDPALLNRERELRQKLYAKSAGQQRAASQTAEQAATFSREIAALTAELEQVEAQIRSASPRYAALTQPQPLTASAIQKQVTDADTLLLEYALGEEQSFLFTISGDSFHSYELPKREIIEQAAQRVYDALTARNRKPALQKFEAESAAQRQARIAQADADFQQAAAELSQMILAPAAAELQNRHLLIVADGKLQLLPFAALPEPETGRQRDGATGRKVVAPSPLIIPLIVRHAITYLPSASVLGVLRSELKGRQPAPKTLAVFADPVFEADDERLAKDVRDRLARERQTPAPDKTLVAVAPADELTRALRDVGLDGERGGLARLPYTRDEANALLALAPKAQTFSALDFAANQDAALNAELSQYRYLHFATHGLIDNTTPELSGLVLSRVDAQGRALDGHLRMVEIMNLRLPAELVVLSACKTGLGKYVNGEGLLSLTRGFMYAGAARVVVSLWDVNDRSTASLMGEFYRGLLQQKLSPAQALRAAQLRMLKNPQWSAPYYWAAFVQHGEPR